VDANGLDREHWLGFSKRASRVAGTNSRFISDTIVMGKLAVGSRQLAEAGLMRYQNTATE